MREVNFIKRDITLLEWPYLPKEVKDLIRDITDGHDNRSNGSYFKYEDLIESLLEDGEYENDEPNEDFLNMSDLIWVPKPENVEKLKVFEDFNKEYNIDPLNTYIAFWW